MSKMKSGSKAKLKSLIPKSGSYDINCVLPRDNNDTSLQFNDNLTFNSISRYNSDQFKSSHSILKLFTDVKGKMSDSDFSRKSFSKLSSKWLGMPLLYLAYFSAFYTLLVYGCTALVAIYYIIINLTIVIIPLYILLVAYLTMSFMSFLLILAIRNDRINVITIWIITLSVLILPEIGLNIVLIEASSNWSYSHYQFIVITLTARILLDLPCLMFVLCYHTHKIKRNNYLQDMLQPLKNNIVNGEVLKIYNNIQVDTFEAPKNVIQISDDMTRSTNTTTTVNSDKIQGNKYIYNHNANHSIYLKQASSNFETAMPKSTIENEHLLSNTDYNKNALHLVWGKPVREPGVSKNRQCYLEADKKKQEILAHHYNLDQEAQYSVENHKQSTVNLFPILDTGLYRPNSTSSLNKLKIDNVRYHVKLQQELGQLPGVKTNPIYESLLNDESELKEKKIRRSTSLNCKRNFDADINIPIEYEGTVIRMSMRKDQPMKFQQYPKISTDMTENSQYITFSKTRQQIVNLSNHHIYLPPAPSIVDKMPDEDSTLIIEKSVVDCSNIDRNNECKC